MAEWEAHFDMLLEWLLCAAVAQAPGDAAALDDPVDPARWQLMEWGARGTSDQRRLAAWVAQQRHLHRNSSLSSDMVARLEVRRCSLDRRNGDAGADAPAIPRELRLWRVRDGDGRRWEVEVWRHAPEVYAHNPSGDCRWCESVRAVMVRGGAECPAAQSYVTADVVLSHGRGSLVLNVAAGTGNKLPI